VRYRGLKLLLGVASVCALAGSVRAQQPAAQPQPGTPVIRKEARLVLVDTVVTDKHGHYIRDLKQSDFKVWEDNKEQVVKSFSYEASSGAEHNHYLVLFFDNSTMDLADQAYARKAAAKFIEANAGPNRLIAVAEFGGTLQIAQNFTSDTARLAQAVKGVKASAVNPNAGPVELATLGAPSLGGGEAEFGMRSMLAALRTLAKNLAVVQGRKAVVLLTSGFPLTVDIQPDLTAAIDACNKANVAVYPVDVRGLVSGMPTHIGEVSAPAPRLLYAKFRYDRDNQAAPEFLPVQHAGGGGGGGGHAGGGVGGGGGSGGGHGSAGTGGTGGSSRGGTGNSRGTAGGATSSNYASSNYSSYYNPAYQPRAIVPPFPNNATTNQQVLYMLADGTGGFVILNTNDLLGGIQKIADEQNEYYVLGYTPPETPEGSCHTLRVRVDRGGTVVRSRSGYCNVKSPDALAGAPLGRQLQARINSTDPGTIRAFMRAPFFYISSNVARVNLALDILPNTIQFEKEKGKYHSALNVLGIAYKDDGTAAARFSDTVDLDFDSKHEVEEFAHKPFHYENQFEIAPGHYTLKLAFSSGAQRFGKLESPLVVDPYDRRRLTLSDLALSDEIHRVSADEVQLDAAVLEDHTPLLAMGDQVVPAANYAFHKKQLAGMYVEVYEPLLLQPNPPKVALEIKIVDLKSGQAKIDAGFANTQPSMHAGNPVIPLVVRLPLERLDPGQYRVVLRALDSAGNSSQPRAAEFAVE
jgi:VWFA-related protein